MSYGHPTPSSHGRRIPAYRWSPTVLPPSQRRARRGRHARHDSPAPRCRFSPAGRPAQASRASRSHPPRAVPSREPSLGKLLWQGVASMAGGVLKVLEDEALAERRTTTAFEQFLSFLIVLAVMGSSAVGLLLGCLYFFIAYADDFAEAAAEATMEDYDEEKGRMCVTRKTSVEAPPTPEELRRAWEAARGRGHLAAKLLVGTLLSNLEPAVDQSYLRAEDGTIVGRRPGLKGWLRGHCPDLVPHYKALMSYKALADKLRIALGIEEPDTLSGIVDFGGVAGNGGEGAEDAAAAPSGDAAPGRGSKKGEEEVLSGSVAKDAGEAPDEGGPKPRAIPFRRKFSLVKTNEQSVLECIHSMFGTPDPVAPVPGKRSHCEPGTTTANKLRKPEGERMVSAIGERDTETAKTSVFSADFTGTEAVCTGMVGSARGFAAAGAEGGAAAGAEGGESTGAEGGAAPGDETWPAGNATWPATMAALEIAVRERLGLCWMQKAGRRPTSA